MSRIPDRNDSEIRDIKRRLSALESARRANNTSIENGTLSVAQSASIEIETGSNIHVLAYDENNGEFNLAVIGVDPEEPIQLRKPGFKLRRFDGTTFFISGADEAGRPIFSIYDNGQNSIISNDPTTGFGLATPNIPIVFYQPFTPTISSGTFVEVLRCDYINQQPSIYMKLQVMSASGGVGEFQVLFDDKQLPPFVIWSGTIASGVNSVIEKILNNNTPAQNEFGLSIQVRRTNGTGLVGVGLVNCYGGPYVNED